MLQALVGWLVKEAVLSESILVLMKLLHWLNAIAVISFDIGIELALSLLSTKNRSEAAMSYMIGNKNLI